MVSQVILRNSILILTFAFIAFVFLKRIQDYKVNWAVFYAVLWVSISLAIVNFICVKLEFWVFLGDENSILQMPFDLYFIWIIYWGVLPMYFFKGKYFLIILLILFWLDILLMPELEKTGIIKLNDSWLYGEALLLIIVFSPSYLWAKFSFNNNHLRVRALFQVVVMALIFSVGLPYVLLSYTTNDFTFFKFRPGLFQLGFIIVFPALIAVQDLVVKGKGTPFPYDKTNLLVQTGVYAYCRNPIQWSFTLLFVPLSIYYESFLLLLGSIVSIAYTFGVSNQQEHEDMKSRFGDKWTSYKKNVPSWRFLWKPKQIPLGKIYFKRNCNQCEQLKNWFTNKKLCGLELEYADELSSGIFLQVTYIDNNGMEFKSVKAISYGLEHINLAYATLGWFMRFPIISFLLQAIIDSMNFDKDEINCDC